MTTEYKFEVLRLSENIFSFLCKGIEETGELYEKMCQFFPGMENKIKLVPGIMANINTVNRAGLQYWSDHISNYVHELPDKKFKFVLNGDSFVKSPLARK